VSWRFPLDALRRRLITIPVMFLFAGLIIGGLPVWVLFAGLVDSYRWARRRTPFAVTACT
jgi:hypothetical protein